ncbi:uncharacterized protein [Asterias amurensis]|uniref:uncharacterized protein n=1 Tax=Asterias amurensis TaxID=7602 RepID=UPI003AB40402
MQNQLLNNSLDPTIKPTKGKENTALMNPPNNNMTDFIEDDENIYYSLKISPSIEKKNNPKRKINNAYDGEQNENFEMVKKKRHRDTKEVLSPKLKSLLQQDDLISRSKKRMKENEVLVAIAREPPRLTYIAPMPAIGFNQFG